MDLEENTEMIPTREYMKKKRKEAYEKAKAEAKEARKQEKEAKEAERLAQQKKKDEALWGMLKPAAKAETPNPEAVGK